MTSRFEKRPSAVMTSSVIPSLKKSWLASPDRFLNGNTATEGRPARRLGEARRGSRPRPAWGWRQAPVFLGLRLRKAPTQQGRPRRGRRPLRRPQEVVALSLAEVPRPVLLLR